MAVEDVQLGLRLGDGAGAAVLMTADLGYRYVQVNAEYTTQAREKNKGPGP